VIAYSKRAVGGFETGASAPSSTTGGDDIVIVVINLDPHATRETMVHLDMAALGLDWNDSIVVDDAISGDTWTWGEHNYVRLDPGVEPAHVLSVRKPR
jgi:starch synthase (maltosyl-transferring)